MPFTPVLTSTTGYFRFHGRNRSWFREPVDIRYDYLYSEKELRGFVEPILDVASRAAGATFVFFNNCHSGKAARNALTMIELLKEKPAFGPAAQSRSSQLICIKGLSNFLPGNVNGPGCHDITEFYKGNCNEYGNIQGI